MIVVRMELHSAVTGQVTELGQLVIANTGTGTRTKGNYEVRQSRKGKPFVKLPEGKIDLSAYDSEAYTKPVRGGHVQGHPRLTKPVWNLLYKALVALGHDK